MSQFWPRRRRRMGDRRMSEERSLTVAPRLTALIIPLTALIVALLLCAGTALSAVTAQSLPKPTGYVSDLAGVVSAPEKQALEQFCTSVEQQLGVQFALV